MIHVIEVGPFYDNISNINNLYKKIKFSISIDKIFKYDYKKLITSPIVTKYDNSSLNKSLC